MNLPKVTLFGSKKNTYVIVYGTATYEFSAGVARKVPVPIALEAQKKRTKDGHPLFQVEMPAQIVSQPKINGGAKTPQDPKETPKQTATATPGQASFNL